MTYFEVAYVLLFVWRCQQVYRYLQSFPPALQRNLTIEEFLGRGKQFTEYWLLPVMVIVGASVGCVAMCFIIGFIAIVVVVLFIKVIWDLLIGQWLY